MNTPMQIRRAVSRDADAIAKLAADAAAEEGVVSGLEADRIKAHAFGSSALFGPQQPVLPFIALLEGKSDRKREARLC